MRRLPTALSVLLVWLALFAGAEAALWLGMKAWVARHPSDNPLVNEYFRRGHPLFTDNEDLRAQELGYAFDPYLGYALRPSTSYPYVHRGQKARLDTDASGRVHNGDPARNPALFAEPGQGLYRVVLFGGSSMIGQNASDNAHTIPADLQRLLEQRFPGVTFHVVNAGVFGYQSTQERLSYELAFRPLRPDLVIFLDGFNDAAAPSSAEGWQPHRSNMMITPDKYVALFSPAKSLAAWASNLLRFPEPLATLAMARRAVARSGGGPVGGGVGGETVRFHHPEAAAQLEDNVTALAAQVRASGGRALFVLQPFLGTAKPLSGEEQALLSGPAHEQVEVLRQYFQDFRRDWDRLRAGGDDRIRYLDLTGAFTDVAGHVYDDVVHYNDLGDQILAERLADAVGPAIAQDLRAKGLPR